jgi:hypothetical protein
MHLLLPFAAPLAEAGREVLRGLRWRQLGALLAGREMQIDRGDEWSATPPHERALVRLFGWRGRDGEWPFAARLGALDGVELGIDPGVVPVALLSPVHWHLGTEQISLADPAALVLDEPTSRAAFDAVADLFTSEGFTLVHGAPGRWYAGHCSLEGWPSASLDRVIGRNVDRWLPAAREARLWRRLQNEAQMRLHEHPINLDREARGLPAINSLWLSGNGRVQPLPAGLDVQVDPRLRGPALAEDWAAWAKAWAQIDDELPQRGLTTITLCGERSSLTVELAPQRGWRRLRQRLTSVVSRVDPAALLAGL